MVLAVPLCGLAAANAPWATNGSDPGARGVVVDPANPQVVYAVTDGTGAFVSTDGAASWSPANNGLTDSFVVRLAMDPSNSSILYAGTEGGNDDAVFRTTDGAATWANVWNVSLPNEIGYSFAIDPSTPSTVYVGTSSSEVYESLGGGASWSPTPRTRLFRGFGAIQRSKQALASLTRNAVCVHPTRPARRTGAAQEGST